MPCALCFFTYWSIKKHFTLKKKKKNSRSKGGPSVNEVSFRTRPHHNAHNTLGVDTFKMDATPGLPSMSSILVLFQTKGAEHFTLIVGSERNRTYNCQFFQLRNNGFRILEESAIANPSKISLSQFCTMRTFYMAQALLTEAMLKQ